MYPAPAFMMVTEETVPSPEITATPVALVFIVIPIPACIVPIPAVTPIETKGAVVNPAPPPEIIILEMVPAADTNAVAATPVFVV